MEVHRKKIKRMSKDSVVSRSFAAKNSKNLSYRQPTSSNFQINDAAKLRSITTNLKIIELIEKEKVVTSSDVARHLKVSWNTADSCLKELLIEGKLIRMKKTGVTLWTKK